MDIRVGFGFDVHQLHDGQDFIIGGVHIEHRKGAVGHSDADVLIHAICDALLGAANLKDIGTHFPDSDGKYENIDSSILLNNVIGLLSKEGYSINNIDSTVCLEAPKIKPYIASMQEHLSEIMKLDVDRISIKATTSEKMGFVGREEGVTAYATVLIQKPSASSSSSS